MLKQLKYTELARWPNPQHPQTPPKHRIRAQIEFILLCSRSTRKNRVLLDKSVAAIHGPRLRASGARLLKPSHLPRTPHQMQCTHLSCLRARYETLFTAIHRNSATPYTTNIAAYMCRTFAARSCLCLFHAVTCHMVLYVHMCCVRLCVYVF